MEPTKKKLKRSNDHAPCSSVLSPSAEFKRDGDYFSQGKDVWSPQYEVELKIQSPKEQGTVAGFESRTDSLLQSRDVEMQTKEMQTNEDFPQVTDLLETSVVTDSKCRKQFLTRCQITTPLNINHDFMKDSDVLNFQFQGLKDELDVSNCIGKHLLRGCSSRVSLTLHEPKLSHGEGSESVMPMILNEKQSSPRVLETREGGSYCDVFSDRTPNCSLGSSWQDTDWFTPQRSSDMGSVGIGKDSNIIPIGTAEFGSYEDKVGREKYLSYVNVGNSVTGSFSLSSEWSPMFSTPSATKWESDYQKGCRILEQSLRLGRMPDPEFCFSAANNINFDHEVIPEMDCWKTGADSFTDIQNSIKSDEIFCKSSWEHADDVGIEQYSIRKDKLSYRDGTQNNVGKQRSKRSRSAPPFCREKKRFISLSCRSDTKSKNSDPSGLVFFQMWLFCYYCCFSFGNVV